MNNEERMKSVLANIFKIDAKSIDDDSSVDTIETWDSLTHLNLVLALENEFDVSFTEEQTVEMMNYQLIKINLTELGISF